MRTRLSPLLPIVVAVAALGAQGAHSDQDPQQPTFRAGVNVVRVDVIATDRRGTPITDLTRDDFEILENGTPQAIEQFRLVDVDGNPGAGDPPPRVIRSADDEALEAGRDDVRIFAIMLADYQVCWERQERVREVLARFVQTRLGPNDLVAVMGPLTPVNAFRFTYDHEQIVREIRRFEARKGDYVPRNLLEEEQWLLANQRSLSQAEFVANMEAIRHQVVTDALKALAVRVGSMREGRKTILFVSEGFSASSGSVRYLDLREIARDANRQNASIYPLDPRGFVANAAGLVGGSTRPGCPAGASQDTLRDLADDTDGRALMIRHIPRSSHAVRGEYTEAAEVTVLHGETGKRRRTEGPFDGGGLQEQAASRRRRAGRTSPPQIARGSFARLSFVARRLPAARRTASHAWHQLGAPVLRSTVSPCDEPLPLPAPLPHCRR